MGIGDQEKDMSAIVRNYKELSVWQKAVGLAVEAYKLTRTFPNDEKFGMTSQLRRAATSISSNIAEGWGRGTTKEYIQFLLIARGSLMEMESQLVVGQKLGYLSEKGLHDFQTSIEEVGRMLNGLVRSLRSPQRTSVSDR